MTAYILIGTVLLALVLALWRPPHPRGAIHPPGCRCVVCLALHDAEVSRALGTVAGACADRHGVPSPDGKDGAA